MLDKISQNSLLRFTAQKRDINFGSKKYPRYLYHLTTKNNWDKILQSGELKFGYSDYCGNAVFMTDLINLFTKWKVHVKTEDQPLLKDLTCRIKNKDDSNLVLLKIPTDKLAKNKLFLRSLNELFEIKQNPYFNSWLLHWINHGIIFDKKISHLFNGISNDKILAYRRKHAVEYVYKEVIPSQEIEKIGETSTSTSDKSLLKIWQELLKGNPEEKALLLLDKYI